MNIHEYQAKGCWPGTALPSRLKSPSRHWRGAAAAEKIAASGSPKVVVKSQIHAGGAGRNFQDRLSRRRESRVIGGKPSARRKKCSATSLSPGRRASRPASSNAAARRRRKKSKGILSGRAAGPRKITPARDGQHRRRHGHRGGRRKIAGENLQGMD